MRSRLPWRGPASRRRSPGWRGAWWVLPSWVAAPDGVGPGGAEIETGSRAGMALDGAAGTNWREAASRPPAMRLSGPTRIGSAVRLYYVTSWGGRPRTLRTHPRAGAAPPCPPDHGGR